MKDKIKAAWLTLICNNISGYRIIVLCLQVLIFAVCFIGASASAQQSPLAVPKGKGAWTIDYWLYSNGAATDWTHIVIYSNNTLYWRKFIYETVVIDTGWIEKALTDEEMREVRQAVAGSKPKAWEPKWLAQNPKRGNPNTGRCRLRFRLF